MKQWKKLPPSSCSRLTGGFDILLLLLLCRHAPSCGGIRRSVAYPFLLFVDLLSVRVLVRMRPNSQDSSVCFLLSPKGRTLSSHGVRAEDVFPFRLFHAFSVVLSCQRERLSCVCRLSSRQLTRRWRHSLPLEIVPRLWFGKPRERRRLESSSDVHSLTFVSSFEPSLLCYMKASKDLPDRLRRESIRSSRESFGRSALIGFFSHVSIFLVVVVGLLVETSADRASSLKELRRLPGMVVSLLHALLRLSQGAQSTSSPQPHSATMMMMMMMRALHQRADLSSSTHARQTTEEETSPRCPQDTNRNLSEVGISVA